MAWWEKESWEAAENEDLKSEKWFQDLPEGREQNEEEAQSTHELSCHQSQPANRKVAHRDKQELAEMGHDHHKGMMQNLLDEDKKYNISQDVLDQSIKFTDPQFPAQPSSLVKNISALPTEKRQLWRSFQWKRAEEIYNQPIKVFNFIDSNDILQGALGDCYFLSALSAIAEHPCRIQKLFDTQDFQPSGRYTVKICEMGIWTDYVIDDYFPYDPESEKVAFSGPQIESGISELWVLLLEKAWAKRFGSYWAIDAGLTSEALRDLTGGPCEDVYLDNPKIWDKILHAEENDFIITASSREKIKEEEEEKEVEEEEEEEGNKNPVNEVGIVDSHAYSVIAAKKVKSRRGIECLLQIRNPWGNQEWQGDWSDHSDLWTPALKTELKLTKKDDGTFWMASGDFKKYFWSVTICKVHDDYHYEAIHHTQAKESFAVFKVTFESPGNAYFITTQVDARMFDEDINYKYSPMRIIVAKLNESSSCGNRLEYVTGMANIYERDVWCNAEIEAGTYLVYTEANWKIDDITDQYGFSVYSASPIELEDVSFLERNFIHDAFNLDFAKKVVEEESLGSDIYLYKWDHMGQLDDGKIQEGFRFYAVENRTEDFQLEFEVNHKEIVNFELLAPYEGLDSYKINLGPGENAVIIEKQLDIEEIQYDTFSCRKKLIKI